MSDLDLQDADDDAAVALDRLPLDAWHRARGGRMVPFAGYEMPVQYDGIMAEHLWTRESAGLFDVSHMGQLVISGEGAAQALEALVPGDISALKPGRVRYTLLLAENGGVLDDLMVTRLTPASSPFVSSGVETRFSTSLEANGEVGGATSEALYLVVNGATKWDDIAHLREFLPDEITLNHLDEHALLALQGPKAVDALARLGLVPVAVEGAPVERLTFMQAATYRWQGVELHVSRSGYTGEDGFEISVSADAAVALADALCAEPEVKPIGLGARDSLRLEAGLPLYGHDLDPDTTPVEADLTFALSKKRREAGGFAGAERIAAQLAQGAAVKRVGLIVEGRQPVREGAEVVDADGRAVGRVTSGGFAPTVQKPIAMAYVPAALAAAGTVVTLAQRGKSHRAEIVAMPFVPHRYVR
ncbi:glycine cleavage system aminomethyltransferase GcvT [Sphingomonas sp. SFZ2018-12]|uniref:glycine cleavage system aminomethyltransferase GcvT n=1 Tax=Sphingomonas sp. SFZ2018-12 TaxID=2683197 RepID=UPI001F102AC5|nr:glycine cleavage system aminomethyltransferase GcvT [Sphingomonas sp. SFZ2018-12]MCH4891643.1 glycine cleavage system aminomethyltransferase GcvT [Sphingomonas sp. SFZ2018-12]